MSDHQTANRSAGKGGDPFAAYAAKALSQAPAALLGPIKRRGEARERYSEIVADIHGCDSAAALETWLAANRALVAQFAAELEFLWLGDGDFRGLKYEIEWAGARFDAGLDFPRREVRQPQAEARN
jgi:hypothetical protein